MTKVKSVLKNDASYALGDAPEEEYTFLLVPVAVYSLLSQQARQEDCSVGELFQRAIVQYLQPSGSYSQSVDNQQPRSAPDIAIRRKKNT